MAVDPEALQEELWEAFKAGVVCGDQGFADNEEEMRVSFAVHVRHRAIKRRKESQDAQAQG